MLTTKQIAAINAMEQSLVSTFISFCNAVTESTLDKSNVDTRAQISDQMRKMAQSMATDDGSWPYVKENFLYDIYLEMRRENGTLSDYDLVRPGLISANFSSRLEYDKHRQRIFAHSTAYGEETKVCSSCGTEKPKSSFKKRGGSVCNSCKCKAYRARKAQKAHESKL